MIGVPERRESGMPPSASRQVRLSDVCQILNGYAFESALFNQERGTPLIRIRDLRTNSPSERYDGDFDARYLVPPGAYLVGMDGEFRCYKWSGPPALLNQRLCRLLPDERQVDGDFLYLALNDHLKRIESETSYTTVKHISSRQISGIELPLPALPEQERIAAVLRAQLDAAACMRAAAECQVRLAEGSERAYLREVWQGERGRSWPRLRLDDVAVLERGKFTPRPRNDPRYYDGAYPWIQTGDVEAADKYVTMHSGTLNERGLAVSKLFRAGTLVMTIAASVGAVGILGFDTCMPDSLIAISPKTEVADTEFLYYTFLNVRSELESLAPKTAQANLKLATLNPFRVRMPSLEEQLLMVQRLNERFTRTRRLHRAAEAQAAQVATLAAALLSRAFSGGLQ